MTGEYEPEDSRNVTGTATTPDGRWTGQGARPPLANGQEPAEGADASMPGQGAQRGHDIIGKDGRIDGREDSASAPPFARDAALSQMPDGRDEDGLAGQIKSHMMVIDSEGRQVGTVDHVDGDRIKLTRAESPDGEHRYLPLSAVASVEADAVRLAEGNRAMLSGGGD